MFNAAVLSLFLWPVASLAASCKPNPPPPANVEACKLPAQNNVYLSVGFNYSGDCVPTTGELRAFMMFVDFSDAEARDYDPPKKLRDFFLPDAVKWYEKSSNGRLHLNVTADISQYYRMPSSAASYHWETGLTSDEHAAYIQDALRAYTDNGKRAPPPETEVLYIVPTRFASAYMTRSMAYHGHVFAPDGGSFVARKTVTFGTDPFDTWGYKTLNHETGHTMCLPDYYPYGPGLTTQYYVGGWSAMGDLSGPAPDFFAWDKWRLGWLSDSNIDCITKRGTSEHVLTALEVTGGKKAVVVAANDTMALIAEARVAESLDTTVCAPGVLLYTVDTSIPTGEGPIRVLDANPSTGGCGGENGELNDATLSLDRKSEFDVPGWGVIVKLVSKDGGKFKIRITYK